MPYYRKFLVEGVTAYCDDLRYISLQKFRQETGVAKLSCLNEKQPSEGVLRNKSP